MSEVKLLGRGLGALLGVLPLVMACAPEGETAADRGEVYFASSASSPSKLNFYSCATCHGLSPEDHERFILPGAWLGGVVERPSYWAGQEVDLLRAINDCRSEFLVAPQPLEATDADARDLFAYLSELEPKQTEPVAFTVVRDLDNIPRGDAQAGLQDYASACAYCHGEIDSGLGQLSGRFPVLPQETVAAHPGYTPRLLRLVFIEKVRHGAFLNYGGDMPPFSREVLSDEHLGNILEALGITGE
jgi:thiosulfate dehydrogenase